MQKSFPQFSSPLYHHSSPSLFSPIFQTACHQTYINTSPPPPFFLSCPLLFRYCFPSEWCQNRNALLQTRGLAAVETRTFSGCVMPAYVSLPSLCLPSPVSSLSSVISLTVFALFYSPCLSVSLPLLSAFCHSPLSNFHRSICWPTGCVTESVLWAAWGVFVNNTCALLNSVCGF